MMVLNCATTSRLQLALTLASATLTLFQHAELIRQLVHRWGGGMNDGAQQATATDETGKAQLLNLRKPGHNLLVLSEKSEANRNHKTQCLRFSQSASQPANPSVNQFVSQSVHQSVHQSPSVIQSVRPSVSHSVIQSVSQAVSQAVSQPASQSIDCLFYVLSFLYFGGQASF